MNKKGMTLIETLIYVAIVSGMLLTFSSFMLSISDSRNKTYVVSEVQANTRNAFVTLKQKIHEAKSIDINNSVFDTDPCILSLEMSDPLKNPTIISLTADNGSLQIQEGVGAGENITTGEVSVEEFMCKKINPTGKRSNVQIFLTVSYNMDAEGAIFDYSQSLETAFSVRGK